MVLTLTRRGPFELVEIEVRYTEYGYHGWSTHWAAWCQCSLRC